MLYGVIIGELSASPERGRRPAIICMGGVIATAVYDATGAKMLRLPMAPERVKEALRRA